MSALPNIITVKERRVFDSHENNINLRNHTNCVFAVRMSSFIPLPKVLLEYTHLDVTLLLECHHQNAECSTFCWMRWLSCLLVSFYCLSYLCVDDIHISSPKREKAFCLSSPKHGWCTVATHFSGDVLRGFPPHRQLWWVMCNGGGGSSLAAMAAGNVVQ